jgi:hypothetical protein
MNHHTKTAQRAPRTKNPHPNWRDMPGDTRQQKRAAARDTGMWRVANRVAEEARRRVMESILSKM